MIGSPSVKGVYGYVYKVRRNTTMTHEWQIFLLEALNKLRCSKVLHIICYYVASIRAEISMKGSDRRRPGRNATLLRAQTTKVLTRTRGIVRWSCPV